MGKVVLLSYPYFGHVNPTVSLVKELVGRGEQVIYYTTDAYMKFINIEGVICRSYGDIIGLLDEEIAIRSTEPLEVLKLLIPHKLNKHQRMANLLIERIMKDDPDYIIRDCESYWGKMIGVMLDVPVICYITTMALNETMIDQHSDFFVRNVLGSPDGQYTQPDAGIPFSEYLNVCARELSRPYAVEFKAIDAFSGADELNLVFTSREFQPFADTFGPNYLFLGPSIRKEEDLEVLEVSKSSTTLVYISMGTVYNDCLPFYAKCIEAFRDTGWQVVMSIGQRIHVEDLGVIPENFIVRSHMPQIRVLQMADVFITHGGHNSASEAMFYQVPMVMFPQAADQFAVSGRIQEIGAGVTGSSRDCTPEDIAVMTKTVLEHPSYRKSCEMVSEAIRNSGGAKLAVDGIFHFLNG
ncbi:macrolide family glycosyltransferase [Paenibacillus sp. sgz500958]|uniref:macrolide family glycosyltransferase n=1 Tax=Paenibacillus sp. sgz500958 TaxID=3242475 RepID=UPI0036D2263D